MFFFSFCKTKKERNDKEQKRSVKHLSLTAPPPPPHSLDFVICTLRLIKKIIKTTSKKGGGEKKRKGDTKGCKSGESGK
jgi:hypothetical protein